MTSVIWVSCDQLEPEDLIPCKILLKISVKCPTHSPCDGFYTVQLTELRALCKGQTYKAHTPERDAQGQKQTAINRDT